MNRNSLTTAVVAGIAGVVGIANMANAVNLNPDGLGQVLLYPYYTVNNHQQTLLSVVNTTSNGKAVKVRFLEGYNSREVLDFNLFLSPFDVWTASVFKLSDGSVAGDGAAIFTKDNSCTAPTFSSGPLANGAGYQAFLHYGYTGTASDGGPTGDDRTLEGHFEMISMADITAGTLLTDITHVNGVPAKCSAAEGLLEAGGATVIPPTGGLFGAASVVNVGQGTYYTYNADAVDGFTSTTLVSPTGSLNPSLRDVNDVGGTTATAFVFNNGALVTAVYASSNAIDAVSALFDASNVYNQYQHAADGSTGSDWVVTFPTKRFYVDTLYAGVAAPIIPFESRFSGTKTTQGLSCDVVGLSIFDREERTTSTPTCGFSPCPPGQPPSSICHETNVITFGGAGSSILGSNLTSNVASPYANGWLQVSFTDATHGGNAGTGHAHASRADNNGTIFYGLPVSGFEAENFVNGSVGGVLANYSGVYRHRNSRCADTTQIAGACS
ncbi:MAG TPA: hypothetical protein VLK26_07490 [Rudaea sp.]|nr:hypothetical protein [Rudaea sp.]